MVMKFKIEEGLKRMRKFDRFGTEGQALVEFAISASLYILLILAVFDVGRLLLRFHLLTQVAREGARIASVTKTQATVELKIGQIIQALGLDPATVTVGVTPVDLDGNGSFDVVDVTAQQVFREALGVSILPGLANVPLRCVVSMPLISMN